MPTPIVPGLLVLHSNQLEQLRAAVFQWLRDNPLDPLEPAIFLVQSNGVAEWLKIAIAEDLGVCAATRIELPGRFLWRSYRAMLGGDAVPTHSALDKAPLTWRLMQLLPGLLKHEDFAPLRYFLRDGKPERRLQLAQRLADLFDQYQVYRADWLSDWAKGIDQVQRAQGAALPLADDQRWQAQLWRAVLHSLPAAEGPEQGRATVHHRFLNAIEAQQTPAMPLPRRIVLFGVSALPLQTLEALAALAAHTQVLLAIPNPCQYYWGDIIAGRDLLKAERKRQQQRHGRDLAALPLEQVHAHSHPLLAAWGRQGRDFIRMLDDFDNAEDSRARFANLRIDLFTEEPGETLLQQIQSAVRDMLPLDEHSRFAQQPLAADDRSVEFHVAHSAQREVEVLHDQLLCWFAAMPYLKPRDIVVMVPDIEVFSPAILAVFDQYGRHDARRIPFVIGDVRERGIDPLLMALDWLLRLPQQRCRQSEIRDLLDVPALAARFGLTPDDLPRLTQWMEGSGVRWGLDSAHRKALGLGAAGEQNAWIFGLRRMLLGYASGNGEAFDGIAPYAEVGGLEAGLAGSLAQLIDALIVWRATLAQDRSPKEWGQHARQLLHAFFKTDTEHDRLTLTRLHESLQRWLEACDSATFDEAVSASVLREAWLGAIDEETLEHKFVSGGVTFCTLMPMRAIPFPVVCLLGMNDGDYPRRAPRNDFDLLAQASLSRPGDRARRDDDRYLMLEALLAARRKLYISWAGRHVRDNSEQPPSVLVSQLRDYLRDGWGIEPAALTTEHPLQAFSRRYFEEGGLPSHAREWQAAHRTPEDPAQDTGGSVPLAVPLFDSSAHPRLSLTDLGSFLRQPVNYFFRQRLVVRFDKDEADGEDDEPFELQGLPLYDIAEQLLADDGSEENPDDTEATLRLRVAHLARCGVLPIGASGQQWQQQLVQLLLPTRRAWLQLGQRYAQEAERRPFGLLHGDLHLEDWLSPLRQNEHGQLIWRQLSASKLLDKDGVLRADKLISPWLRQLAAAASGVVLSGHLVGRDAIVRLHPLETEAARATLSALLDGYRAGMDAPLPVARQTTLNWLASDKSDSAARLTYEGGYQRTGEVEQEPCLDRLWPDFATLRAQTGWEDYADRLYQPLLDWMKTQTTMMSLDSAADDSADHTNEGEQAA
ncbi:exodeoxyribonuclease V subunit gamma [Herbaspirillum sp. RTI4]|uniref:exodeoxyribonuclease V subunit gamma n=1 Tax=Herbaspirillum sp. RTI4 TaxID=3048640 RepID=UPI002AB41523|nr:exodeoxyribonuclease V subunit gamma [Herbaspirillum sp. RTI4]MDY7577383.1 exodeoxyribonuclease V subunit gamma [Herbaspirillum sp. RTI4]MEA9982389.1 exodeoxyribonuclease V subunit gamma [Herbaspirillum sp. RTI4]